MYDDEIMENVPAPKTSADFDASVHMIISTENNYMSLEFILFSLRSRITMILKLLI